MSLWNTGSISNHVGNLIGWNNIGTISGTTLNSIVTQNIYYVEQYTTDDINPDSILEKYQPSIIKLTQADVLLSIEANDGGIDNVKLGELSYSSGKGGNTELAIQLRTDAIKRLKELQRSVRFKRVIGGC